MKITAIESILLKIPYESGGPKWETAGQVWTTMDVLLVRIDTDDGVTGWGEAFGHSVCLGTKATLDSMVAPLFIGRDPTDIVGLTREMAQRTHIFGRNGSVQYALSGIDIALWDIAGKRAGLPIFQLLGGSRRGEFDAYASFLRYTDPKLVAENAARAVERGYRAIKLHEIDVPQVAAAREAIGPDIALMMDVNCPWTVDESLEMVRRLTPYDLYWLEEPVWPPEDHDGLARVRSAAAASGIRVSAGENAAGLHDFRRLFAAGAIDIAQPSVTKIGGITEMRKIIALAEAHAVRLVPHCAYFGPGLLASLHLAATLPGPAAPFERLYVDLETSPLAPWTEAMNGKMRVPQGPGLGCDPAPEIIERYRVDLPTRRP
ncbi:MAG TPA: mandelate racemase/muconate lactonizing enzyme family protein [Stellaceae bacterium]